MCAQANSNRRHGAAQRRCSQINPKGVCMSTSRMSLMATMLALTIGMFAPVTSFAESSYFNSMCSTCHAPSPSTCNGCHGHGTHGTDQKNSLNLSAETDKTSYVVGDDITVTLKGGYKAQTTGWVRVNLYDKKGVLLVSNKAECPHNVASYTQCDLPVKLKVRAQADMVDLYVAWMGNAYDSVGAVTGVDVTSTIGVGKRAVSPTGHVEEIVLTNAFTVTTSSGATQSAGGGAFDWALIAGLVSISFLRRKMSTTIIKIPQIAARLFFPSSLSDFPFLCAGLKLSHSQFAIETLR